MGMVTTRTRLCLLLVLTVALTGVVSPTTPAKATGGAIIDNGVIQLGVHDEGHLNVLGDVPSAGTGTLYVGLRDLRTGNDFTAPGCICEGWGAADEISEVSGQANEDVGGVVNLTVVSADFTESTALTVTDVGSTLRVTHHYFPSPATDNLYEVTVTIENISAATVRPLYRRVMDWDMEPTAFSEFVTIQGTATAERVYFASNDGFAFGDPLAGPSDLGLTGDFVDEGPADHGALFDFRFEDLAPSESVTFRTFYGSAPNAAQADAALGAVGAEVFSYGKPNTPGNPESGEPNTAIFAFSGVGGDPQFAAVRFTSDAYTVGEADGSATIDVELTAVSADTVTVEYATAPGTATAGVDYEDVSGTLTFPPGTTSTSFAVPIIDNDVVDGDRTVLLTLSAPSNAFLGTPATATLTIVDDDEEGPPPPPPASVDLAITATATPDPVTVGDPLTIDLEVTNGGPDAATGVTVTHTLPAGIAPTSLSDGCVHADPTVTCTIGDLAVGASRLLEVVITPSAPGTLVTSATVTGAEDDPNPANNTATTSTTVEDVAPPPPPPADDCVDLLAGRTHDVGEVCLARDGADLVVTLHTTGGWTMSQTHVAVAADAAGIPQTRAPRGAAHGNPIPGHFAHAGVHPGGTTEVTYRIPLGGLAGAETLVVAAHADVWLGDRSEGAWGAGTRFNDRNWATYITW